MSRGVLIICSFLADLPSRSRKDTSKLQRGFRQSFACYFMTVEFKQSLRLGRKDRPQNDLSRNPEVLYQKNI
jgi:hypothetical protein